MKTLFLALYTLLAFIACNPVAHLMGDDEETHTITVKIQEKALWYSDFALGDLMGDGTVYYTGEDTLLTVTDPVITYYSTNPIKTGKVTIFHDGVAYPVDCTVRAYEIRVFNDVIYGAGPDIVFLPTDRVRFEVEAQ